MEPGETEVRLNFEFGECLSPSLCPSPTPDPLAILYRYLFLLVPLVRGEAARRRKPKKARRWGSVISDGRQTSRGPPTFRLPPPPPPTGATDVGDRSSTAGYGGGVGRVTIPLVNSIKRRKHYANIECIRMSF
jgi:hypothetical protein